MIGLLIAVESTYHKRQTFHPTIKAMREFQGEFEQLVVKWKQAIDKVPSQGSPAFLLLRHNDFSQATVFGPASVAPVHHAICTPIKSAPAKAAFWPTDSGKNGIANRENHNTPESKISPIPILAAERLFARSGGEPSQVETEFESEFDMAAIVPELAREWSV